MTSKNVPGQICCEGLFLCKSTSRLMNCKEFYALLERYCNSIEKDHPLYDGFLNLYFNDEGYVDIWRIPYLMIDAFNQDLGFHKMLECEDFRKTFHQFLAELYNFCLHECQTELYVKPDSITSQNIRDNLKIGKQFLNTLMGTFISVMENIENYDRVEMKT